MSANANLVEAMQLQDSPAHLLRLSLQRLADLFSEQPRANGLTLRQFVLLLAAYQQPGSIQAELVARTGIDRSTVGDMLDRLVRRGFISRRRSGNDQRANAIFVLPEGVAALAAAMPAARNAQEQLLEPIPPELRSTFALLLRRVAGVPETTLGGGRGGSRAVASPES